MKVVLHTFEIFCLLGTPCISEKLITSFYMMGNFYVIIGHRIFIDMQMSIRCQNYDKKQPRFRLIYKTTSFLMHILMPPPIQMFSSFVYA